jgi:ABC-type nitrate/sulfonate/bicarbonate transport system substrate-binding protein
MSGIAALAARWVGGAGNGRALARLVGVAALATLAPALAARSEAAAPTLALQLSGPAQFEFAGYYAALWKGYYDEAGLDVEIRPSGAPGAAAVDPVHEVTDGHAQFGVGTAGLVVQAAQGLPLLLLAPIFQSSGAAVYYRTDGDFASPGALVKARVGRPPATDILNLELTTALRGDGIDPTEIRLVPVEPGQVAVALADRRVDAAIGSAWTIPWRARARNLTLKSFNPADYRVEFYGDTLFTSARFARVDPEVVQRFRAATLKGWAYALDNPDEIASRLVSGFPPPPGITDAAGFARYQADIARRLTRYPEVQLGHSDPERWNRIETALAGVGALVRTTGPDSFVYDPAAEPLGTRWRDIIVVAAAALAAVAVAGLLLWRPRRRTVPAPRAASTAAAEPQSLQAAALAPAVPLPISVSNPVDLNTMLFALEPSLRKRVPAPVNFRLSLLPELWPCRADGDAVAALIGELVDAAADDLMADDTLIVGTRNVAFEPASVGDFPGARVGEFARVTVRDNGPGLSDEAFERIFDRDATRRPAVAAASPAMVRLGGFARVESAVGIGTAVHLYFPRIARSEPAAAPPRRQKAGASRAASPARGR